MDSPGSASSPVLTLVLDNVLPLLRKGQKWALPQLEQLSAKSLDMLTRHPAASLWTAGLMLLILAALVLTVAVALVLFFIFLGFSLILSGLIGQYGRASADCTAAAQTSSRLDEPVVKPAATNPTTVKSAAAACNVPDKKTSADASTAPEATTEPSWISFCAAVAYQQVVKPRAVFFWFAK